MRCLEDLSRCVLDARDPDEVPVWAPERFVAESLRELAVFRRARIDAASATLRSAAGFVRDATEQVGAATGPGDVAARGSDS